MRLRSWARMTNTKSTWKVAVGTVKKSQATKAWTWLYRNAFQGGEDGVRARGRSCSTVDLATAMPSVWRAPTIREEPHVGLACHMSWMSSRTTLALADRPGLPCRLQRRQWALNRFFCHAITVRGGTKATAWCQPAHSRASQAQSKRSVGGSLGRGTLC